MARRKRKKFQGKPMKRSMDREDGGKSSLRKSDSSGGEYQSKGFNDFAWYAKNPSLILGAGQIQYPYRPGMSLPLSSALAPDSYIPGVLALNWVPNFGVSTGPDDPASRVAQEIYTRVRASYSGSLEADAPDFLMYIGALDSVFTYIGWLKRIYRSLSTYSSDNFGLPDLMMLASGIARSGDSENTYQDMRRHKDRFFTMINELILSTRKFKCPAVMDLFNRHYWMSDNIFADSPSPRAQLYAFNLLGVYKLAQLPIHGDTQGNTASGLQMMPVPTAKASGDISMVDTLYNFGMGLISALSTWDSGYTIAGYLERAYQGVPSFSVAELQIGELLTAQYSEEVLSQIENATIMSPVSGPDVQVDGFQVTQDVINNSIYTDNEITITLSGDDTTGRFPNLQKVSNYPNAIINVRTDSPAVADTVVATRLKSIVDYTVNHNTTTKMWTLKMSAVGGSELVVSAHLCTYSGAVKTLTTYQISPFLFNVVGSTVLQAQYDYINTMALLEQFDWHPMIFIMGTSTGPTATNIHPTGIMGDIHNPTIITRDELKLLNKYCLYSELNAFGLT